MKPILEIKNISKKYRIQHEKQSYLNIRDSIGNIFKSAKNSSEEFYALKDISFNIMPGESIGIIGKNGAGKSTLLKILSKITPPSSGKIISRGRIASLLEVGTGFHGELSGRENIFLNGSILGMKRAEILKNFDAIIDFAGVEKFLDTALKHYSSGMQLRLAFAVAAFLENEILIIDEVLAVGDAEFQKKCMGKMEDVSKNEGRTVLFVSHNLAAIESLCKKSVVLENGQKIFDGSISAGINFYLTNNYEKLLNKTLKNRTDRSGSGQLRFSEIHFKTQEGHEINSVSQGKKLCIDLFYEIKDFDYDFKGCHFSMNMFDTKGTLIFNHQNLLINRPFSDRDLKSKNKITFSISDIPFKTGEYFFNIDCVNNLGFIDRIENAGTISVVEGNIYNYVDPLINGVTAVNADWTI